MRCTARPYQIATLAPKEVRGQMTSSLDLEKHGERVENTTWWSVKRFFRHYPEGEGTVNSQNVNSQN